MRRPVIVLGAGGNCVDIAELVDALGDPWEFRGFLDDAPGLQGRAVAGRPVLGPLAAVADHPEAWFVNGIGSPTSYLEKPQMLARLALPEQRLATLVHPTASVSPSARLGPGCVVLQQATVASRAQLGRHVIVLPNSVVSHDSRVGDYTCIAGGVVICGNAEIGPRCYLGAGATLIGHLKVGEGALIGMGSVVREEVQPGTVVVGNPARRLRRQPGW